MGAAAALAFTAANAATSYDGNGQWARSRRCCPTCSAAAPTAPAAAPADAETAHRTS